MSAKQVMTRLSIIFTSESLKRLNVENNTENGLDIIVDVHGMNCKQVRQLINNIIATVRGSFLLTVIHGYTHGSAILEMLRNTYKHYRIQSCRGDGFNYGITYLKIA